MKSKYAPKPSSNQSGKMIPINNLELYYEEIGAGKPLLLLHGFGGCSQNWHPFINEFSAHFKLILVDLRGHGYSSNPENTFTHRDAANDLFLFLDALNIPSCSAMGMSTGGMILLHMATMQPKRLKSMVLISATTHFPEQARAIMRRTSYATMPLQVKEMYRKCAKHGEEQIHQLISQFNSFHTNSDDMNFTKQVLSTISASTFLIHGENDAFFPTEIPEMMNKSIPNSELWVIPNGEHVPIYEHAPEFSSKALHFLQAKE
ncbi:alpha/beta hydrolase [bacterium]|nr:MAG: alpha/beta hydrolase [bacterium]